MSNEIEISKILRSRLIRSAFRSSCVHTSNGIMVTELITYLLETIDRLARNVQFTEFTEHGLPHIAGLVDRISEWTLQERDGEPAEYLVNTLTADEAFLLAIAVIIHDMGMLSQNADDLPSQKRYVLAPHSVDLPMWVRRTHVERLELLMKRMLREHSELALILGCSSHQYLMLAIRIAETHNEWPSDPPKQRFAALCQEMHLAAPSQDRLKALAAVLAVADLLDEDYRRCDTEALLGHKRATTLNRSHWLRHMLVAEPPQVKHGIAEVTIRDINAWSGHLPASMEALSHHLKKASQKYNDLLTPLSAEIRFSLRLTEPVQDPKVDSIDYFAQAPDLHILRAFPDEVETLEQLAADRCELSNTILNLDRVHLMAKTAAEILPTDHDAITTLRAVKGLSSDAENKVASQRLVRLDAMLARERGDIALAMKLVREYSHEQ